MLNEAVIDYWADIYRACSLQTEISFDVFLTDPWRYLRQFGQETAPALIEQGLRPLLPVQARVARKLAIAEHRAERMSPTSLVPPPTTRNRKSARHMPDSRPQAAGVKRDYADAADRTAG